MKQSAFNKSIKRNLYTAPYVANESQARAAWSACRTFPQPYFPDSPPDNFPPHVVT